MSGEADYYAIIGVPREAQTKEISKEFRKKARLLHPDKQPATASVAQKEKATQAFQQLAAAYEVLSDPSKRAEYDERTGPKRPQTQWRPRAEPTHEASHASAGGGSTFGRRQQEEEEEDEEPEETPEQRGKRLYAEQKKAEEGRGLGAHWVKPKAWSQPTEKWGGWEKSNFRDDDEGSEDSSVLSFEIRINVNDINVEGFESVDAHNWDDGQDEVWTFPPRPPQAAEQGSQEAAADVATQAAPVDKKPTPVEAVGGTATQGQQRPPKQPKCCTVL